MSLAVRFIIGAVVAGLLWWLASTVLGWRERSAELNEVQQQYAEYRTQVAREARDRETQQRIDREITTGYIATIQKQGDDIAAARRELRGVRLRLATAAVPAGCAAGGAAPGRADDPGSDGQSAVVEAEGPGLDAEEVAERFAACDAAGARLNALIVRDAKRGQLIP